MNSSDGRSTGPVNYYHVLKVHRNATLDDIEMAYAKAALRHHPDVAGDDPEVQKRFALINEAYTVLSNQTRRQEYDQQLGGAVPQYEEEVISSDEGPAPAAAPVSGSETPAATEPVRAAARKTAPAGDGRMGRKELERTLSRARQLISKGDFWRADSLLRKAVFSYPANPELRRLLARSAEGRGRFREAVEELKAAVDAEYFNPENHYLMGKMFLKGGMLERAEKAFQDALSWQEDYKPAIRGIAEIRKHRRSKLPWWKKLIGAGS